ncbi:MAG: AsmA family protein, partial [Alphaproteobacteria bacterium]
TLALTAAAQGLDTRPAFNGRLRLDHPDMDGFLDAIGRAPVGAPGPLKLDLALAGDAASLRSENLSATFGPASVSGSAAARLDGAVPSLDLVLNAGDLVLDPFLGGRADGGPASAERWSTEPLELDGLRAFDGHLLLNATSASFGAVRLDNAVIEATLAGGVLRLDRLAGGLFGGSLQATGRLAAGELNGLDLNLALADVDAYQALAATSGYQDLRGRLDLDGRLDSLGASEADLVGNLAGDARVALRDGVIEGYDLTAINERLKRLDSLIDFAALAGTSLQGGSTPIRQADGTFVIERGVARSTDLRATMDGAIATGEAVIDLPRWVIAANGQAELQGHRESPPLGIRMRGPLDQPETSFDTKALQAFVAKRVVGAAIQQFGGQDTQTLFGIITGQPTAAPESQALQPQELEPLLGAPEDSGELPLPGLPESSSLDTTTQPAQGTDLDGAELPEPALPQPGQQGTTTEQQLFQNLLQGVLGGQN